MTKSKGNTRGLTKTQRKLLERVRAGHWYGHHGKQPKAMDELVRRGLVHLSSRVAVMKQVYVPAGFKLVSEVWPEHECSHTEQKYYCTSVYTRTDTHERIVIQNQCQACGEFVVNEIREIEIPGARTDDPEKPKNPIARKS